MELFFCNFKFKEWVKEKGLYVIYFRCLILIYYDFYLMVFFVFDIIFNWNVLWNGEGGGDMDR